MRSFFYHLIWTRVNTYIAMLDTQENVYYGSFYEDTAVNAGMKLKFFTNIDLARNWLKKAKM
ncbi:MAG: hypothetical protein BWX55_00164 [Deltaproteobacteria bacterium ADurb.Bin022]|nr:MAG: hypothetical protein BWX55_00164 [Deltaproteobacteria bacterium ADurb.Bin022]